MRYRFVPLVLLAVDLHSGCGHGAIRTIAGHIRTNTDPVAAAYDPVTHRAYVAGFELTSGRTRTSPRWTAPAALSAPSRTFRSTSWTSRSTR